MARVLLDRRPQSLTEPPDNFKPLDFGANGINGSLDWNGRIIALNWYHPQHGYVTLTSADPFPEDQRYNPAAVRTYRAGLASLDGFGLDFTFKDPYRLTAYRVREDYGFTYDEVHESYGGERIGYIPPVFDYFANVDNDQNILVQKWRIWDTDRENPIWRGRLSLQRCAYTQLTEGGPLPSPLVQTHAVLKEGVLTIENPQLGAAVAISGFIPSEHWEIDQFGPVELNMQGNWEFPDGELKIRHTERLCYLKTKTVPNDDPELSDDPFITYLVPNATLTMTTAFGQTAADAHNRLKQFEDRLKFDIPHPNGPFKRSKLELSRPAERGLTYGLKMFIPVGEGLCILTDHMLLPLSWNRDAYYVARALLSWSMEISIDWREYPHSYQNNPDLVRRHLIWMFEIAERPNGVWGRCYLANGRQKDPAFQLDQQLWPLLEFAEYVQETGDHATFDRLQLQVSAILDTLLNRRKSPDMWLFPTDETPADDPIALPYHLSSHILFWRTLMKLAAVFSAASVEQEKCRAWAEHIRAAIQQYFVAEHPKFGSIYAYATDGEGHFHFYHDANDFPLVLAPIWRFCATDDPVWRATIAFAWSQENEGGYYAGRLGSVHTRAAWPLGDVQELIAAQILGDAEREQRVRQNLEAAAQWDGALPEAVDPITNAVVSRHWFAWPNAALACVELGVFRLP